MKNINVSEATGPALNWLVAKAEGQKLTTYVDALLGGDLKEGVWISGYGSDPNYWVKSGSKEHLRKMRHYSTDWAQGGPIIGRERISLWDNGAEPWDASMQSGRYVESGVTPLIAAMRCFVASKLGETTEVPEELT